MGEGVNPTMASGRLHPRVYNYVIIMRGKLCIHTVLPRCYTPLFATYFLEKEGGERNNEDLHFHLTVKPPPLPRIRVLSLYTLVKYHESWQE